MVAGKLTLVTRRRRRVYGTYGNKRLAVAPKIKKYVKRAIKSFSADHQNDLAMITNYTSIGNAWIETDLTDIDEGDDLNARTGRMIQLSSFTLRGSFVGAQNGGVTDDAYNTVRIVLALWDSTTNTPLATNGAIIDTIIQKERAFGKGLVKVYYDKTFMLNTPGVDGDGYLPAVKQISIFKKLGDKKIKYCSADGATAEQKLILSIISDSSAIVNPGFVHGRMNLRYEDN